MKILKDNKRKHTEHKDFALSNMASTSKLTECMDICAVDLPAQCARARAYDLYGLACRGLPLLVPPVGAWSFGGLREARRLDLRHTAGG